MSYMNDKRQSKGLVPRGIRLLDNLCGLFDILAVLQCWAKVLFRVTNGRSFFSNGRKMPMKHPVLNGMLYL